jgi:hypothetical protein
MTRVELLLAQMDEAYGRLRAALAGLADHDAHHGGEIGCLRDLYRVTAGGA